MATRREEVEPRTFYLNEQHELARGEKAGGGRPAKYAPIDWQSRAARLNRTLRSTIEKVKKSADPGCANRYYVVAVPVPSVDKTTDSKSHPSGIKTEKTRYSKQHSLVFRRLGLDLLDVPQDGQAVVHGTQERFEQLVASTEGLASGGVRLQSRFVSLDSFGIVPDGLRVDQAWLEALAAGALVDVFVELQPFLTRVESDEVVTCIKGKLEGRDEGFSATGTDYSGRRWVRGRMARESIALVAREFFSVQSIHQPLHSELNGGGGRAARPPRGTREMRPPSSEVLPCVALVDCGVPREHPILAPYRRGGGYVDPQAPTRHDGDPHIGDHGSLVASRIVFGDLDERGEPPAPGRECSFFDVMVGSDAARINDKGVLPALQAVVATAPDVRVFNLSFGDVLPLSKLDEVERRERLALVQDLDNFIVEHDVVVIIAAGNSQAGMLPSAQYPGHQDDPMWALGAWPSGFNTLTCGSAVERLHPEGIVRSLGWPSPFTRIGPAFPGQANAPIPEFSAHGGNGDTRYHRGPGMGVWGYSEAGLLEDHAGTSQAAPLLAREAAFALAELQKACAPGTKAYAATAKAFLALTAAPYPAPSRVAKLAKRTLGFGRASAGRLIVPRGDSAVFIWQGRIAGPDDIVRVAVPIPEEWLRSAREPRLRVACAWDTPVNAAVRGFWGCRKVAVQLRAGIGLGAVHAKAAPSPTHPLWVREYELSEERLREQEIRVPSEAVWLLEISYEQMADYYPAMEFSAEQRVGIAMELLDQAEGAQSPQRAVQALPLAATLVRLSAFATPIRIPVQVRAR